MLANLYTLLLIGVTLAVILSRRTMYAILFLILLFALVAVFVYSLGVDFIGLIFVIVYVGAIATLFLFIVMMLGGEDWEVRSSLDLETNNLLNASGYISSRMANMLNQMSWYVKHIVLDLVIILGFGLSLINLVSSTFTSNFASWLDIVQSTYNTSMFDISFLYGVLFYDYWYLPFLLAGVVLLIAMLGSIVLTTHLMVPDNEGTDKKSTENKPKLKPGEPDLDDPEVRKRILNAPPSPDIAHIIEELEFKYDAPMAWWIPQLIWTGICVFVGLSLQEVFITSLLTKVLFIGFFITVYLLVSFKLGKMYKEKARRIKAREANKQ